WAGHSEEEIRGKDAGAMRLDFMNHSSLAAEFADHRSNDRESSDIMDAGKVASAGELKMKEGLIQQISDSSGHFLPDERMMGNLVKELGGRGADLHDTAMRFYDGLDDNDQALAFHASAREFQETGSVAGMKQRRTELKDELAGATAERAARQ